MATDKIRVDGPDGQAVFVRANRSGYGLKNKILSTASQLCAIGNGGPRVPDVWAVNNATLHFCIVSWEGEGLPPYKSGQRFPMEAIDDLDEDFGGKILEAINDVNKDADPDPKDTTAGESG